MNPMRMFISARETAIEDYINKLSQESDPDNFYAKQRIAQEVGLDLFSLTDWEIQRIEEEVQKRQ